MKIEVHLQGGLRKIIDITPGATVGATIGRNVFNADGTLYVPPSSGGSSQLSITSWELILNIPPNVTALANTATTGLYVITGAGTSATRSIQAAPGETTVSNGDGVAGNPAVGLADVADTGAGALRGITRDAKGRINGTTDATITGTAGQVDVANGDAAAGLPTISLADVADAGGGTFKLLTRDAKGRLSGTSDGDTDDVPEGVVNLYFTDARAQAAVGPVREKLSADRNYYVSTTGNDANNGLSIGSPFLTIQKAANTILSNLDTNGFRAIINIADGTYTGGFSATVRTVGGSSIELIGNVSTPANVVIAPASGNCINANFGALCQISGMTLRAVAGTAVASANGSTVFVLGSVVFDDCANDHILADSTARVYVVANYSVIGDCTNHWHATNTGSIFANGLTITISGTPTMVRWAGAAGGSVIGAAFNTYSGSVTGAKFLVHRLAIINTEGAGISAFPGSVAGSEVTATGGYYV